MSIGKKISTLVLGCGAALSVNAELITLDFELSNVEHYVKNPDFKSLGDDWVVWDRAVEVTDTFVSLSFDSSLFNQFNYSKYHGFWEAYEGEIENYNSVSNDAVVSSVFSDITSNYLSHAERGTAFEVERSSSHLGKINFRDAQSNYKAGQEVVTFFDGIYHSSNTDLYEGNIRTEVQSDSFANRKLHASRNNNGIDPIRAFNLPTLVGFLQSNPIEFSEHYFINDWIFKTNTVTNESVTEFILYGAEMYQSSAKLSRVNGVDVNEFMATIPEPSSIALFGLASIGLLGFRKKHV